MPSPLRFGILGTGNIASQFAAGVAGSHRSRIVAVASRDPLKAREFAARHQLSDAFTGTYDALLADKNVQAVYLSFPNSMHHAWTLRALAAGKHVLCEKPFALNAAQSEEMFDAAQKRGLLLVEAFMYASHPQTHAIEQSLRDGEIGELRLIRTSFCYRTNKIAGNIRFDRALAGGALMDVGCYCISFSRRVARSEPIAVHAVARMHPTGVDETTSAVMLFPNGVTATFTCGMSTQADNTAEICGTEGYLEIPWPWKPQPTGATFTLARSIPPRQDNPNVPQPPPRVDRTVDAGKPLYALEADDFAAAVLDGNAPAVSRDDTMGNMRVMDDIRRQIGLSFPSDSSGEA